MPTCFSRGRVNRGSTVPDGKGSASLSSPCEEALSPGHDMMPSGVLKKGKGFYIYSVCILPICTCLSPGRERQKESGPLTSFLFLCSTLWVWWAMFNLHVNLMGLRISRDACPLGVSIRVFTERFNCGSHHLIDRVSQTEQKGTLAVHQHPVYSRLQKQCDRLP